MGAPCLDLSKPANVVTFLADTPFACTQADVLTGGNANYLYRLHLVQPYDGCSTAVLKHSRATAATSHLVDIPLPLERQEIEAEVLRRVHKMFPEDALVTAPKLYHYDGAAHFIIMQDCGIGSRMFKDFLISSPNALHPEEAERLGTALGAFISTVQEEGTKDAELMACVAKNTEMRKISAWYFYGRLLDSLTGGEHPYDLSPEDIKTLEELVEDANSCIASDSSSFTVGDFWTGNTVVDTEPDTREGREGYMRMKRVFIVDWEVSKPGIASIDVAQYAAELHTARAFFPGKDGHSSVDDILPAYFKAYAAARTAPLAPEDLQRMSTHLGAHMAVVTPRMPTWKPEERVREFVVEAIQYLLKGKRGDLEWLKSSESILKDVVNDKFSS
ncbi:hypothetical protein SCHPADRAFT_892579 [Schizopora paradoxa]|uniref:Uncharacterized protein n=1 Tax=Schizopora paradoxa TaxID=27342 RepID=A0A0H2REW6_9AGAM|nr:hypothetical protein SCHPADRAFT_892579 [Schizopora paradoxa]